jgi:hypothetical protein
MPDVSQNKTFLEDVWMIGCDKAHQMEHQEGPGHKSGTVFPSLKKGNYYRNLKQEHKNDYYDQMYYNQLKMKRRI